MYGLLGKKLGHSFSKIIHEDMINTPYELIETDDLNHFFNNVKFSGINVTIPYKQDVIQYLDELSPEAKEIGAVNTILSLGGKLKGYNTDYYGLTKSLSYHNVSVKGKTIVIMGNGSTSRTIEHYCRKNLAENIIISARNPQENEHHFQDVDNFKTVDIIFNATPVGMFPDNNAPMLFKLDSLPNLTSVIDVIYNPLQSNLLIAAKSLGKQTVNGLFMLIAQAVKSIEIFHNISIEDQKIVDLYNKLNFQLKNIVFIGMPMSGKSYFARLCSDYYHKELVDLDNEIELYVNDTVENIFKTQGERYFRKIEHEIVSKFSKGYNQAISCGGGVILNPDNMRLLKHNGLIIFIDVPLAVLKKCNPKKRPLLQSKSQLERLYNARHKIYTENADIIINKTSFNEINTLEKIEVKINEYFST